MKILTNLIIKRNFSTLRKGSNILLTNYSLNNDPRNEIKSDSFTL